jgi:hypothetical protein
MAKVDPKAKAKRQKIILAVLAVVLLGVLAWQVPSVLKIMNKKPPAAATAPAPAAPVPGAPVPGATAPVGTPVAAPAPSGSLADSDPAPQAAGGQLISFDRFASKDPFQEQLGKSSEMPAPKTSVDTKQPARPPPTPPPPSSKRGAPTSAKISVNGSAEEVGVGQTFPQADPIFVLVSLTAKTAKVGISGGSIDTGSSTVTLRKGKKLTLMNTVDGARYELVLVSVG